MKSRFNRREMKRFFRAAQAMIEYLLLLGATVVVVLLAFKQLLPKTRDYSNSYFNKVAVGIMGDQADGFANAEGFWYKARSFQTNYP